MIASSASGPVGSFSQIDLRASRARPSVSNVGRVLSVKLGRIGIRYVQSVGACQAVCGGGFLPGSSKFTGFTSEDVMLSGYFNQMRAISNLRRLISSRCRVAENSLTHRSYLSWALA